MGNFPLIGSFLSSRLSLMIATAFFCSSPTAKGSSVHIWQTPVRNVPGVCTDPVLSSVTRTVPLSAGLRRKGCHNRTRDPTPWFVIPFSLYHQATQDGCSVHPLPDQCLLHPHSTHTIDLPTCLFRPRLVIVLIKKLGEGCTLCWFPW